MASRSKPIRVFYSTLTGKFYASQAYRERSPGLIEITGRKFDVTQDIAGLIARYAITFAVEPEAASAPEKDGEP